jgi:hypothetical protein
MRLNTKIAVGLTALGLFVLTAVAIQYLYGSQSTASTTTGKTLDETFGKADFAYGPQAWKPYFYKLPVVQGHDAGGNDDFYVMFIDLNATPKGIIGNNSYTGGVKVEYSFKDLTGLAAFNVYCYAHGNDGTTNGSVYHTNRLGGIGGIGESGYYVYGTSKLAGTAPRTENIDFNHMTIRVANNNGVKYDAYDDGMYHVEFFKSGGGLNTLHLTTDINTTYGQITYTNNQTGTFFITATGGNPIEDAILMVAVNGTIPDTFEMRIEASMNDGQGFL